MTKAELIAKVAKKARITKAAVGKASDCLTDGFHNCPESDDLASGQPPTLRYVTFGIYFAEFPNKMRYESIRRPIPT